jgi:uncharacterized protein YajQ (UPF0234 family)
MNAWDYVKRLKSPTRNDNDPWTVEDWQDFYNAIDGAMEKIARRHGWKPKAEKIEEANQETRRLSAEMEIPL